MKKIISLTTAFLFAAFAVNAQTRWTPVDGGISVLLIAGAAGYGLKLIVDNRKKKKETNTR
jgi:hypothetical protein